MLDPDINALNVSIRTKLNLQKERDNARKDAAYRKTFNRRGDYSPAQNNINPVTVQHVTIERLEISESPINTAISETETQPDDAFFDFANDIKPDPRVFSLDLSVEGKPKKQAEVIDFETRKQIAKDDILERIEKRAKTYSVLVNKSKDPEACKVALKELLDRGQVCRFRENGSYKYCLPKNNIDSDDFGDDFDGDLGHE